MDQDVQAGGTGEEEAPDAEGVLLRAHLFEGQLLDLPIPEEGIPGFLPDYYAAPLHALVYPPITEREEFEGGEINLQISPYNLYYGGLRALAECADAERADVLRQAVLEWNPNAALEVCELAREHLANDLEVALLHYELAMELDENLYEAHQDAGMCEYALGGAPGEDMQERRSNAETLFRRALELRPDAGLTVWSLARALYDRGSQVEAEQLMRDYLRDFPAGDSREMVEQALLAGFQAEEAESSDEQQIFQQAQALAFGDDPQGAIELLLPLAEAYPDQPEIWFILGCAYRRDGDPAEAERCLRRASRLMPQEPFIWLETAHNYMEMRQWRPAEAAIRKAIERDGQNADYFATLGRILLELEDFDGAREAAAEAEALVPEDPAVVELLRDIQRLAPQ